MITLRELLVDKTYKEFFLTRPELRPHPRTSPPWRVYVQRKPDGSWAKKDFWSYVEAFKFLKKLLPEIHDAAIHCRGVSYKPPSRRVRVTRGGKPVIIKSPNGTRVQRTRLVYWTPKLEPEEAPHVWCPWCRRPVEIRWFSKHHSFNGVDQVFDPSLRRCVICGASELLMRGLR